MAHVALPGGHTPAAGGVVSPGGCMSHRKLRLFLFASILWFASTPARSGEPGVALELPEAQALALTRQPLLEAQAAAVQSARESAVAAAQLPDPKLAVGVTDLPIDGPDRY